VSGQAAAALVSRNTFPVKRIHDYRSRLLQRCTYCIAEAKVVTGIPACCRVPRKRASLPGYRRVVASRGSERRCRDTGVLSHPAEAKVVTVLPKARCWQRSWRCEHLTRRLRVVASRGSERRCRDTGVLLHPTEAKVVTGIPACCRIPRKRASLPGYRRVVASRGSERRHRVTEGKMLAAVVAV
jgi:hypothetical protein